MFFSFSKIILWLLTYKYLILFPIVIVEGPIITIIAGFLSSLKYLNIYVVYLVAVSGDIVGDSIFYAVGRWGRMQLIERWGHYVGLTAERILNLEKYFETNSGKTLIFGKLSHAIGAGILIAAGASKMQYKKFIFFNFLATLPKSLLFLLIGFYFGHAYIRINTYLDYIIFIILILCFLFIFLYFYLRSRAKKFFK